MFIENVYPKFGKWGAGLRGFIGPNFQVNVGTGNMNVGGQDRATGYMAYVASDEREQRKKIRKRGEGNSILKLNPNC